MPPGSARRTARGPWSSWRLPRACRDWPSTSAIPWGPRRSARGSSCAPCSTPARAGSCWASAAAPRTTAERGSSTPWEAGSSRTGSTSPASTRRLAGLDLLVACDVSNPLLGPDGAAATYGPQKGATPADVEALDQRLASYADLLEAATGRRERDTPGAGAAGGVGFALLCLADRLHSLSLEPGVDLVAGEVELDAKLARADLVITGEGRIDAQTAFGKTALGVARRAQAAGVRCIAVGGGVDPAGIAALAPFGVEVVAVHLRPIPVAEAMAAGAAPLVACGERLARGATWLAA